MALFNEENSIFKMLNNYASKDCNQKILEEVISLDIASGDKSANLDVFNILNIVGIDKFCDLVTYLNGRTVRLPKTKQWASTLVAAVAWYYHTVEGKPISEIKDMISDGLGLENHSLRERKIQLSIMEVDSKLNRLTEAVKAKEKNDERK